MTNPIQIPNAILDAWDLMGIKIELHQNLIKIKIRYLTFVKESGEILNKGAWV